MSNQSETLCICEIFERRVNSFISFNIYLPRKLIKLPNLCYEKILYLGETWNNKLVDMSSAGFVV